MAEAKRSGGLAWLLWAGFALALVFVGRQVLVGDAASLIAHLWVAVMDIVFKLLRPLFGG